MATDVDICNRALVLIGSTEFLASIDDVDTAEARVLDVVYEQVRDALLHRFWWPFATKEATLGVLDGVTREGWGVAASLPADCLSLQYLSNGLPRGASLYDLQRCVADVIPRTPLPLCGSWMRIPFAIENSATEPAESILLTNQATPILVYTALVPEAAFSPGFVEALAYKLAEPLALGVSKKPALAQQLAQRAEVEVNRAFAALLRGQQGFPQPQSGIITSRE